MQDQSEKPVAYVSRTLSKTEKPELATLTPYRCTHHTCNPSTNRSLATVQDLWKQTRYPNTSCYQNAEMVPYTSAYDDTIKYVNASSKNRTLNTFTIIKKIVFKV